jgi:hypothetical protein
MFRFSTSAVLGLSLVTSAVLATLGTNDGFAQRRARYASHPSYPRPASYPRVRTPSYPRPRNPSYPPARRPANPSYPKLSTGGGQAIENLSCSWNRSAVSGAVCSGEARCAGDLQARRGTVRLSFVLPAVHCQAKGGQCGDATRCTLEDAPRTTEYLKSQGIGGASSGYGTAD